MKSFRKELAAVSTTKALRLRKQHGLSLSCPISIFDLSQKIGVEVRFLDVPSMEGIYLQAENPTIIISSMRPVGRQSFTCAHELGHHIFEHGEQFDELVEQRDHCRQFDPVEFQADCFAGALLMPKSAVLGALSSRKLNPAACGEHDIYKISTWLGVGYTTLIYHMEAVLNLITLNKANQLRRFKPYDLRSEILGKECSEHLVVADYYWVDKAIDLQVGQIVILPPMVSISGDVVSMIEQTKERTVYAAISPGIAQISVPSNSWSAVVRVEKKGYIGRAMYRHLSEVEDG